MYKDRGIIKWQPFDALNGFRESINNLLYKKSKVEQVSLLEDKLNELDYIISESLINKSELTFIYYQDGYYKECYGFIKRLDNIKQEIVLTNGIIINVNIIKDVIKI